MADEKDKSPATVRRDYRGTRGAIDDADPAPKREGNRRRRPARSRRGVTADQARRTEHTGEEGERAYGTPINTGAGERGNRRRRREKDRN